MLPAYQPYITFAAALMILILINPLLEGKVSPKRMITDAFLYVVVLVGGLVLYMGIGFIFQANAGCSMGI